MLSSPQDAYDKKSIQLSDDNHIGIGLYLCKHQALQFGGDLDFVSSVGKGSTFIFNLDFELDEENAFTIPGGLANQGQLEPFPSGRFRFPHEKESYDSNIFGNDKGCSFGPGDEL